MRSGIAEYLKRTRQLDVAAEQVLVAPGCKMALALAMMALIEPGDDVLYPDPGFPIYPSFTRGLGAKAVPFRVARRESISAGSGGDCRENHVEDAHADFQFAE